VPPRSAPSRGGGIRGPPRDWSGQRPADGGGSRRLSDFEADDGLKPHQIAALNLRGGDGGAPVLPQRKVRDWSASRPPGAGDSGAVPREASGADNEEGRRRGHGGPEQGGGGGGGRGGQPQQAEDGRYLSAYTADAEEHAKQTGQGPMSAEQSALGQYAQMVEFSRHRREVLAASGQQRGSGGSGTKNGKGRQSAPRAFGTNDHGKGMSPEEDLPGGRRVDEEGMVYAFLDEATGVERTVYFCDRFRRYKFSGGPGALSLLRAMKAHNTCNLAANAKLFSPDPAESLRQRQEGYALYEEKPNLRRKNKGGGSRAGDWTCPACKIVNFASRDVCFKCGEAKPAEQGGGTTAMEPKAKAKNVGHGKHTTLPHAAPDVCQFERRAAEALMLWRRALLRHVERRGVRSGGLPVDVFATQIVSALYGDLGATRALRCW
jgi:hypothetical protein